MKKFLLYDFEDDRVINNFNTFETSWIGLEQFIFEKRRMILPILNIEAYDKDVLNFLNLKHVVSVFIEESFFLFENVSILEKDLGIHSNNERGFIEYGYKNKVQISELNENSQLFKFGGMGIIQNNTYDGIFSIYCEKCYFVLPDNFEARLEHKGMHEYDPLKNDWLINPRYEGV